jgi:hypothetical protein
MPIPVAPYDPNNRFMKCAREHKLDVLERSDIEPVSDSYIDNRFTQCALENKMRDRSVSEHISDLDNRFTQFAIQGKTEHRPRTYSQNTDHRSQTHYTERRSRVQTLTDSPDRSPKSIKKDTFTTDDFPTLSPLCTKSPKSILMSPLRITTPIISSSSITSISVKGGKVIQKDIYENIEPLTITPSKWSDVLQNTSGK